RRLLPPPDLQGLGGTNSSTRLHITWPAVPGAATYRVQLAPDADFHSFLIDTESAPAEVDLPAPTDGNYWVRVRSIDSLGLEGRDAVKPLVQHRLPAPPTLASPSPQASVAGNGAAFAWTGVEPGVRYRVQIARDEGFSDPFLERDAGETSHL